MSILVDYGCNEQGYIEQGKHRDSGCPKGCPRCGGQNCLIGHGYYPRKAKDEQRSYWIRVKRWYCKDCHCTLSVLPNFLFPHRHYLVRVIQSVVTAYFEGGKNWEQITQICCRQGTPVLRTLQRWCKALSGYATRWLAGIQQFLAQQDSLSTWLDPQGEAPGAGNRAAALLAASLHLLAWAKTEWVELKGYGLNDRLQFLGLWGSERDLGRLV